MKLRKEDIQSISEEPLQLIYLTHQMIALADACFLSELPLSSDNLKEFTVKVRHMRNFARDHDTARASSI